MNWEDKKDVGAFFSRFSKDWDTLYGEKRNFLMRLFDHIFRRDIYQRYEMTFKALEGDLDKSTVLDIGCGNGIYSIEAIDKGASRVVGVDVAKNMIKICREIAQKRNFSKELDFIVSNFPLKESLKKEIGKFDYSIVMGVMDYVYEPELFLKQLKDITFKKVLITFPGGKFIRYNLRRYRYKLLGRVDVLGYTSEKTITSLLENAGFKEIKITYLSHSGGCYFVEAA